MKSLILDTSSDQGVVAIIEEDRILKASYLEGGPHLSKFLALEIKKIIDLCPPPYEQIIVGVGPGSFTGIRVGAAMAQALSFGWQIPLLTASSLSSFILTPTEEKKCAVAIDARSGGIYVQIGFDYPQLLSLHKAGEVLKTTPVLVSPHPSKIIERLPFLAPFSWTKTSPNPLHLLHYATPCILPLTLHYLSHP